MDCLILEIENDKESNEKALQELDVLQKEIESLPKEASEIRSSP